MSYYIATSISLPFNKAIEATEAALADEGFGFISRIDIEATLKAKNGADFRPYTILGACNPKLAHEALQLEEMVGTMLPCNVVVQDLGSGEIEIAAIDPAACVQAIKNGKMITAAVEARAKLQWVIDSVSQARES